MTQHLVTVRAESCAKNTDGTFTLVVEGRTLNENENSVLKQLFPNCEAAIAKLLRTEAIFASVV